jgi:energy-coupling factor transporter ATP-binding protein EcfA2
MSILQELLSWSKTIAPWQSDALARLLAKQALEAQDLSDLFALLKSAHGIPDPEGRVAKPLTEDQIPAQVKNSTHVILHAFKNLTNVNAIAPNVRLPIAPSGLTIIYGDNGSGKSGYSRVLKRACRARDQSEKILSNANFAGDKVGPPEADFEISINGGDVKDVHWNFNKSAPAELSALAIFDSRCARAYLDQEDDFSYVPYGLDVFEGLVKVCRDLKTKLDAEYAQHATDLTAFANLLGDTEVGKAIKNLSAKTKASQIEKLAAMDEKEKSRHAEIEKSLKENNPKERAAQLRASSKRIAAIATAATTKGALVDTVAIGKLRELSDLYRVAKTAAEVAAEKFKEGDKLLPGTGGEIWRELFDAARKFSAISHEGHAFPDLGQDSPCPLCQQPLEEGAARLIRFEKFVQAEAEETAQSRRKSLYALYQPFASNNLSLNLDDVTYEEIEALENSLGSDVRLFEKSLIERQEGVKKAVVENKWDEYPILGNPDARLKILSEKLNARADTLDQASDAKAREVLTKEYSELSARAGLTEVKGAVLTAIEKLVHQGALTSCGTALRTNSISSKSAEIAEKVVSNELAKALNSEFKDLGVSSLRVALKSRGEKGKALHKLKLELPQSSSPGDILSEGEQRAIAIGSFLAEIGLGGGKGGIVFDDPVSSLDHRRRENVAARLTKEAAVRQVIIFTHDIYFLNILAEKIQRRQCADNDTEPQQEAAGLRRPRTRATF